MSGKMTSKKPAALRLHKLLSHAELVEQAKMHGQMCINTLADVAANGTDAARVSSVRELLERGYGKIGQPVEVSGEGGGPISVGVSISPEIAAIIKTAAWGAV